MARWRPIRNLLFLESPKYKPRIYIKRTFEEGKYFFSNLRSLKKCKTKKPWWKIIVELMRTVKKWKVIPFNYFRQALYDLNTPYSDSYLSFMPEPILFTTYMPLLSPVKYRILIHNKYFFKQLLILNGAETAKLLLWSFSGSIYSDNGLIDDEETLSLALENLLGDKVVFKFQNGSRGENVHFLSVVNSDKQIRLVDTDGTVYDWRKLRQSAQQSDDWLIEAKMNQHETISRIYPHSVNTLRIVTLNFPDGHTEILCALMRFGRNGSLIDSASAGGMHVHIEIDTGRLGEHAYCKNENNAFTEHPDTKTVFGGITIPYWHEVLLMLKRLSEVFMQTHTIGWDVGISENGPLIIEGNPSWNPGTMERGSFPKAEKIIAASRAWKINQR